MDVFPRSGSARWQIPACSAAILALAAIPFAVPLERLLYSSLRALPLGGLFAATEHFATWPTVVAVIWLIWIHDPRRCAAISYLIIALTICGVGNSVIKAAAGRARPTSSVLMSYRDQRRLELYIEAHPGTPIRADGSDQWLLFARNRPYFDDEFVSFPSGHAEAAFVFAAFLIAMYPRARVLWFVLAVACAVSRVWFRRHFPEDVLFGGALGWILATWVFSWRWPADLQRQLRPGVCENGPEKPMDAGSTLVGKNGVVSSESAGSAM
jgi:membrane-associated phospholipid phosphatase